MKIFFQLLLEYANVKHQFRITYIKAKSELEILKSELAIYVYEKKLEVYEAFCKKYPQPKFDNDATKL